MNSGFTHARALRFFVPLAVQAVSQSLTYPLVATVVSRGKGGVADFGAFAQGLSVFFLLSALGSGLITTGMVYGRTREGYDHFWKLNRRFMVLIVAVQLLVSLPPLDAIVFDRLLALDPAYRSVARDALLFCIPASVLFLLRNPYQAALYNARASGAANAATLGRIAVTILLSALFVHIGFVGHYAGIVAFSFPVVGECLASRYLARKFIVELPSGEPGAGSVREQLLFCVPLSFGGTLLAMSGFMVAAFVSRAADPIRMLPIHYVALGIVNPVSWAAMRMQAVVLAFPPVDRGASRTFRFACLAGLALAGITLLGQIPAVARCYFGSIQNLPDEDIPLAKVVMLIACGIPMLQALRGHAEGLAAWRKRPNAILAGQAVYLAFLVCSLFFFLHLGVPGYLMGVCSIAIAVAASLCTIRMGLAWDEFGDQAGAFASSRTDTSRL